MTEQLADTAVTSGGLVVRAVLRTDVGLVRSENQDFAATTTPAEEAEGHPGGRLMIADIFATHQYQEQLAALGMTNITRRSLGWRLWWTGPWLRTHLVEASKWRLKPETQTAQQAGCSEPRGSALVPSPTSVARGR